MKGELFVQLYFYCKNISAEMKAAYIHLSEILGLGELSKGYKLYFLSTHHQNSDDDTTEVITAQLDNIFTEIKAFEAKVSSLW